MRRKGTIIPNAIYKMDGNELMKSTRKEREKKPRAYEVHRSNKSLLFSSSYYMIIIMASRKEKAEKKAQNRENTPK